MFSDILCLLHNYCILKKNYILYTITPVYSLYAYGSQTSLIQKLPEELALGHSPQERNQHWMEHGP